MLEREKQRVAAAARRLATEGLVLGSAGNVSERAERLVAVTPTGAVLDRIAADDVVVVDLDGGQIEGGAPTSELGLHLGAYRRFGVGGVVHTHAPMATAVGCVLDELPVVHYQMLALGGTVKVAPYATFGSRELAELTLDALEERTAALMSNHGTITIGADLDRAMDHALLLEWACTVYWRAGCLGIPRVLDEQQLGAVIEAIAASGYGSSGAQPR